MKVPTADSTEAIHMMRNDSYLSGAVAEFIACSVGPRSGLKLA
jgi:hypothetical protein